MTLLVLISILCIASYTIAVCIKFKGVPSSISATFYKLDHGIWGTSIGGILGIMYTLSSNTYQIIALEEIALKQ